MQKEKAPAVPPARANAGNPRNHAEETRNASISCISKEGKMILQHLGIGRENAISRAALIRATGMPDRALRLEIAALRRSDAVVLADVNGYYLPGSIEEVRAFIRQEESRARSTFQSIQSARQLEMEMQGAGQLKMWGVV